MGQAVASVAQETGVPVATIVGPETPITRDSLGGARVAVEFTEPGAVVDNVKACVRAGCPVVVGTTGWYGRLDDLTQFVRQEGGTVLWAANFAIGVHLFIELARRAGELVQHLPAFDLHLIETHHTAKKDAPSGTAIMLRDAVERAAGRHVPVTSVRVGAVPGTHELVVDTTYEQITLTHTARNRRVFAEGAVAAARWLVGREPGVYTITDMLGIHRG